MHNIWTKTARNVRNGARGKGIPRGHNTPCGSAESAALAQYIAKPLESFHLVTVTAQHVTFKLKYDILARRRAGPIVIMDE
jgi:hypothetical protein